FYSGADRSAPPKAERGRIGLRLEREAEAQVRPGQDAEGVRVRVLEREALAEQRLDADAEHEPAFDRLPAVAELRGAEHGHAGARHGDAGAAGGAARVDQGSAPAQLERMVPGGRAQVAEDDRNGNEARRGAAAARRRRQGRVAEAAAEAEVVLEDVLVVDGVEQSGSAALDEERIGRGPVVPASVR